MSRSENIVDEVPHLYRIISLYPLRRTPNVSFDIVSKELVPQVDAIDRVIHEEEAQSPGPIDDVDRPWYMHPFQDDNLLVLYGTRFVDLYSISHGKVESFEVSADLVKKNGKVIFEGPSMLLWPRNVFHRIKSGKEGSASVNLATHYDGFNIDTNFNIYGLDTTTGKATVLRVGREDQS